MIVQRAGDVIPQVVGPVLPHAKGTKPFRMPEEVPAVRGEDRQARGRGDAPLPQPRLPVARPRDADQLGAWPRPTSTAWASSSMRRLWELGPRPLAAGPLPPDEGAAARARRLRGEERLERGRRRSTRSKRTSRSAACCFGLNIPDVGWVTAQNLARHFGSGRAARGGDAGGDRWRSRASGRSAPRRSPSGSRTRRTGRSSTELARARPALRGRAGGAAGRGAADAAAPTSITGTLEGFSRDEARKALEAKGAKVGDSVSKKTTGVIVGREPGLEAREGRAARRAGARRGRAEEATARLGRSRSGPGPAAPRTTRPGCRSAAPRRRSGA